MDVRAVEVNGGEVIPQGAGNWQLRLNPVAQGYADAQIDDYSAEPVRGPRIRPDFRWRPGTRLSLAARFSHPAGELQGTAGFGFWNAPFGPGSGLLPALPRATWFFYASAPSNLPLAPADEAGRGWFVSTVDGTRAQALAWAPLAPLVVLLNRIQTVRRRLWPVVRRSLGISFCRLDVDVTEWHQYTLSWQTNGCFFQVDGRPVLQSPFYPRGALGFVAWIDNQFLQATPSGRFHWDILPVSRPQWLELRELNIHAS